MDDAEALVERGLLSSRDHEGDTVYEFTDAGLAAFQFNALRRDGPADLI